MIRPYNLKDKEAVLNLLKLNTPEYFDESEEEDLINYLDTEIEKYFVYEEAGKIIGAGGINYFPEEKAARISWDIIHPESQGKGIGGQLTQHRINVLKKDSKVDEIIVRTSQHVYPFYAKMGFALEKVEKDFWAPGFDLYLMKIVL